MKLKKPLLGIKWNLFLSFVLFSAILLVLLWLFQIVFLDSFYREIKINAIKSTAETIVNNIDNEDLPTLVERMAQNNDICILVLDEDGSEIASADVLQGCIIHHMQADGLYKYFQAARDNGGSYLERFNLQAFQNDRYDPNKFLDRVPPKDEGRMDMIIYARSVSLADGAQAVVLLNSVLTPVVSTVDTLRTQLFYISAILILLSLAMALLLSKRISRPIIRINNRSKELAQGNYQPNFETSGYKEIAELADSLNHAAVELDKVETLRRELIANVSHDLRTPLTMISGYAEVMRDLPGENNPDNVQVIIDEARRLAGLVNDILDLSKLQSGAQKLNPATYNLTHSIRTILGRYVKLIDQEGYVLNFEAGQDVFVRADQRRIDQVLYNLINNAISYTGPDKRVAVRQAIAGNRVRIEITDSGEGIPAEQLPYIWDRYYKVDKTHRRAVVGTGLGLSIVKGALELHQAPFGVDSKPGEGSTFWFELNIAEKPEDED